MKALDPCRSCKATIPVLVLARDFDPAWGSLPPGAAGVIHCGACGAWLKWPSREDARGAMGITADKLPPAVARALRARGNEAATPTAKQGGLL